MNRLQALRALIIEAAEEGSRISVTGHTTGRFGETINPRPRTGSPGGPLKMNSELRALLDRGYTRPSRTRGRRGRKR